MTILSIKYYKYKLEVEVPFKTDKEVYGKIQFCKSPLQAPGGFPSCPHAFYQCEMEKVYGTVKHLQGMYWHDIPKRDTMVDCRDMPINYCQNLVDKDDIKCPHCGTKLEVD